MPPPSTLTAGTSGSEAVISTLGPSPKVWQLKNGMRMLKKWPNKSPNSQSSKNSPSRAPKSPSSQRSHKGKPAGTQRCFLPAAAAAGGTAAPAAPTAAAPATGGTAAAAAAAGAAFCRQAKGLKCRLSPALKKPQKVITGCPSTIKRYSGPGK